MKKEFIKSYRECKSIFIIILILTFIFGFNDGKPVFVLKDWLLNLIYVFVLVCLTVLVNTFGYKLISKHLGTKIEIKVWNLDKFQEKIRFSKVPSYLISPILPVLITLFSYGKLFFTPVSTFEIKNLDVYGKKFQKLTYFNIGLIVIWGLFFNLILMIIFKALSLEKGILISSWFIIWNFLPISNLPGAKIFIGSRVLYISSLIFFIVNIFLIQTMPVVTSLIISLFLSILFSIVYYYLIEYLKS